MIVYKELLEQQRALEQQIAEVRSRELSEAVAQVRTLVAEYGMTPKDVFPPSKGRGKRSSSLAGTKVAPKYRNPETGETWTGRGLAPKWIANGDRAAFAV